MRRSGLALILVVGVLGVLAVLGSAFAVLSRLERKAAAQRVLGTQALLLSRSGVEDAQARLDMGQDPDATANRYGGEDWDLSGGPLSAREAANEVYRPGNPDREACPARQAMRPSFFKRMSSGDPLTEPVDGRERGLSGRLSTGSWALKVMPQAGFFVNGGLPSADPSAGYNAVLRRVLGNLAEALDRENAGANDGSPVNQTDGENLVNLRPRTATGWETWEQVKALALAGSQAKLDALRPYLALSAWVDTRTLKPNATAAMEGVYPHTWSEIKLGVNASYVPTRGMPVLEPRAPVNLAWARRRWPVLVALLGGLKGLYLDDDETLAENAKARDGSSRDFIGCMRSAEVLLDWSLSTDLCRRAVGKLYAYSGPLGTWDEWFAFWDNMKPAPYPETVRSVLKANFNPNTRLNKFNPNRAMWQPVDKQDLLVYSTEFCLEPVHAHEVECVGRVLGPGGRFLASRTLHCLVPGPRVARLSTQREFVCNDLGSLDRFGDETRVRIPGMDSPFLPASQGPGGICTWGQDLPGLSGKGAGIQPYPEPYVNPGAGLVLSPADYDGSLQSATLETRADDTYQVSAPPDDMKMLARWTVDLDLAVSDAFALTGDPARRRNQPDQDQAPLTNSLLDPAGLNSLYPDGCYSERGCAPGYFDKDNANGLHGLMTFWVKPNYLLDNGNFVNWGRARQYVKWSNYFTGAGGGAPNATGPDQFFGLVHAHDGRGGFVCHFEIGHDFWDREREHNFGVPSTDALPRRWRLLTFSWNLEAGNKDGTGELVKDDGAGAGFLDSSDQYQTPPNQNAGASASDFTADDRFGPHLIGLGRRGFREEANPGDEVDTYVGLGADSTFDEFAIYDFGTSNGAADPVAAAIALARFRAGRYYKESDYAGLSATNNPAAGWFSAPIDLYGGKIRTLSWTQVVPRGLRSPLPPGGKPGIDGDPGENGRVEMDLSNLAGSDCAPDASGRIMGARFLDSALSRVDRTPRGPFRLHAVFRPNLEDMLNTPILDPLALDDITLLYAPSGGPALRSWGEGPGP